MKETGETNTSAAALNAAFNAAARVASATLAAVRAIGVLICQYKSENPRVAHMALKAKKQRSRKKNLHRMERELKKRVQKEGKK